MKKKILIIFLIFIFCVGANFSKADIQSAVVYLKNQPQNDWTTMALVAAGEANLSYEHLKILSGTSATDYEKRILALTSLGFDPRNFFGQNFLQKLLWQYQNNQIGDKNLLNDDFWGILALVAAGEDVNSEIIQNSKKFILRYQNSDGGFSYAPGGLSDTNDTAAAIMALLETGLAKDSLPIQTAIRYLKNSQNSDGGFPFQTGFSSDTASSAWVISALYKLNENPKIWQKGGRDPISFILSLQQSDGSFKWKKTSSSGSSLVTAYAVVALSKKFYPLKKLNLKNETDDKKEIKNDEIKKEEDKKEEPDTYNIKNSFPTTLKKSKKLKKNKDSDNDGLTDKQEKIYGTNPKKNDTDGDGYFDGQEVAANYDPLSPAPCPIKKFAKNSKIFAYGKPRLSPKKQEKCYARYLKRKLRKFPLFKKVKKEHWQRLLWAFIYGGYSVSDIKQAIKFGGKTVHPVLPKSIWRQSLDYQIYHQK